MEGNPIGQRLRAVRRGAGISQQKLSELSGVTLSQLSKLEQGVIRDPHASKLMSIASALNVSVSDLIDGPEPEPSPPGPSIKELARVTAAYADHAHTEARETAARGEGALELAQKQHIFIERWSTFVHKRINAALDVEKVSSWMEVLRTSLYDLYAILDEVYGYAVEEHANRPAGELAQLQSVREQVREARNRLAASG